MESFAIIYFNMILIRNEVFPFPCIGNSDRNQHLIANTSGSSFVKRAIEL